jgi:chromate transporter
MSVLLLAGGPFAQAAVIALGALAGWVFCRNARQRFERQPSPAGSRVAWFALALFGVLLAGLPLLARLQGGGLAQLLEACYRSGALVFGGGHVVLPLLRDSLVPAGLITDEAFLAGYGVVQAVPGPLFSLASYLGAASAPLGSGAGWALVATVAVFLPGLLLALAGVPLWHWMSLRPWAQGALAGINASVVGMLAAALYDPVWQAAVLGKTDLLIAVTGFFLLLRWKVPPLAVVLLCVMAAVGKEFAWP